MPIWLFLSVFAYASAFGAAASELVVYTYDSAVASGGMASIIGPEFEKRCGCKLKMLASGDGAQLVNRLQLDGRRGKRTADLVLGLDQRTWARARDFIEPWGEWRPKGWSDVRSDLRVDEGFLPFDHGVFAWMADTQELKAQGISPPETLKDLLDSRFRKKLLLQDPRTSTPGLAFLAMTRQLMKEGAWDYWRKLRTQWLTLAPGWDSSYGLFLKKEAPLVWSYTTSQAYHAENGDSQGRYRALLFAEGQPVQIEGAALVKGLGADPKALARARLFLEYLIEPSTQARIAKSNWMLPILVEGKVAKPELPSAYSALPRPVKLLFDDSKGESNELLSQWSKAIHASGGK